MNQQRGFFGIGVYHPKKGVNVGTLWRGAYQLGASHIFTVGARYRKQPGDTCKTWRSIPLHRYGDVAQLRTAVHDCVLVGVEMGGTPLPEFSHPERCVYLLGAEDHGLPPDVLAQCHAVVTIPAMRAGSYNVAQAGTLMMYDRMMQREKRPFLLNGKGVMRPIPPRPKTAELTTIREGRGGFWGLWKRRAE